MNILVISAHPDDETIGMGGTILKLRENGAKIFWLILTRAFSPKWPKKVVDEKIKEVKKVAVFYNFEKTYHLKFKAASLGIYPQFQIVDEISKIIKITSPETVYIPPLFDIHDDHRITANSAMIAIRPQYNLSIKRIISYEIPVTSAFSRLNSNYQSFSTYEDITDYINRKLTVMKLYQSELMSAPHPRSLEGIQIFAKERGLVSGFECSEAFSLVFEKNG